MANYEVKEKWGGWKQLINFKAPRNFKKRTESATLQEKDRDGYFIAGYRLTEWMAPYPTTVLKVGGWI